jgi:hypothetical protein
VSQIVSRIVSRIVSIAGGPLKVQGNGMLKTTTLIIPAFLALSLAALPARAQLLDQLKGAVGGAQGSASGGLGGAMPPAVDNASPSNIAGVMQFCIKNNYLGGGSASSIKDSLTSKVAGSNPASNSGYRAGSQGLLQTGGNESYSLGGAGAGGLKEQATKKVCDLVLQHAKSLI